MKNIAALTAVLCCFTSFGQIVPPPPLEMTPTPAWYRIPDSVNNVLNASYVAIPGTKVSLLPQPGYTLSSQFAGLVKGEYGINVMDLAGGNFESNTRSISRENFEAKGVAVNEIKSLKVNGFKAIYADIQGETRNFMLIIGDSTFSAMIMGMAPKDDAYMQDEIKRCILSVYYDKNATFDPIALAKFSIDLSGTSLKFNKTAASVYIFTPGGEDSAGEASTFLIIGELPSSPEYLNNLESLANNALNELKDNGLNLMKITYDKPTKVDGLPAYRISADMEKEGALKKVHIIVTGNQQHLFLAEAIGEGKAGKDFKKLPRIIEAMKIK